MNYKSKFKMICYIICALFIITKPACALEDSLTYDTKDNKQFYNYKISDENTLYIKDSIDINNGETLVDATLKTLVNDNGIKESTAKLIK
ncbi:hypothetical protein WG909_05440 [Peptostreptococcaceae bacterium AGR-M142]